MICLSLVWVQLYIYIVYYIILPWKKLESSIFAIYNYLVINIFFLVSLSYTAFITSSRWTSNFHGRISSLVSHPLHLKGIYRKKHAYYKQISQCRPYFCCDFYTCIYCFIHKSWFRYLIDWLIHRQFYYRKSILS